VELEYADAHGLDTRMGKKKGKLIPDDVIAPNIHYLHPYQDEIESFQCNPLDVILPFDKDKIPLHGLGGTLFNPSMARVQGIWIDNEKDLIELCDRISKEDIQEIAVDLEAHSYRSFSGFVCLMQISLRRPSRPSNSPRLQPDNENSISIAYDFLIDTLSLRRVMNTHLAPIFANPRILKVMHGANSDIQWLQRDFGIYVINLFDTGIATRFLPHLGSFGLAKLLSTFANVQSDKKHQLSDWRERPLREEMRSYAVSDTVYLLDLYDRLKVELSIHDKRSDIIELVFDESKQICLLRYDKEPFYPSAYKRLINWKKDASMADDLRDIALRELYDWRDRIARELDESLHYVCPDSTLVRIASKIPTTVSAVEALVKPVPPLVLSYAHDIIASFQSLATPKSTHLNDVTKITTIDSTESIRNVSATSVESSKYDQNFYSSNINETEYDGKHSSDTDEDEMVVRNVVEVHSANEGFIASSDKTPVSDQTPPLCGISLDANKNQCDDSEILAARIHQKIAESYSNEFHHEAKLSQDDDDSDDSSASSLQDLTERDNTLPRSLREIYR